MTKIRRACVLTDELAACRTACVAGKVSDSTFQRVWPVVERFAVFVGARLVVPSLGNVTAADVECFVKARLLSGRPATLLTMHDRRTTVRLLFRIARSLGLVAGDPTLDLELPARSSSAARPLTDDEIEVGRDAALWSLSSHRMAAIWALAEATGRGSELGAVLVKHVNLDLGRVWLPGGSRTCRRLGVLTPWGVSVLRARVAELDGSDVPVGYAGAGRGIASQVSTCSAISSILVRAGLAGEADVRPTSVPAWAGRVVFDSTGSIDQAARVLGVRSLDQAARIIDWDWTE